MHPFGSPPDSTRQSGPGTLGALVDAMPLPSLVICGGQVEYVNRAAQTLLGPEPVGRPLDDLVHPADREGLSDALDRCAIRTACGEVDVRLQTHQGSVDARVEIMPLPGGGARRLGLLLHDLGGVRVAERALQESEERYRLLVEHSPDAIYVHERGRILYANPAAARLLGLQSPADLVGRYVLDHVHPDDRAIVAERMAMIGRTGRPITHVMTRFRTYDGRDDLSEFYRGLIGRGWAPVRIGLAVERDHGSAAWRRFYDELGRRHHVADRPLDDALLAEALAAAGLPVALVAAAHTDARDAELRASHHAGMDPVGTEVGTPTIHVRHTPDTDPVAFFGPVVAAVPRGDEALRLWDGVLLAAGTPDFFELKRSRDRPLRFD